MNPGRRLNHAQCHQTIVGTDAKMPPKFCQNCGFCNPSKLPRFSPSAFVRLIVCVWFPTFCRINGNFIVTDWAKVERSQKSDGTQSFPTNIYKPKISHCTISPNCQFFNLLKTFKRLNMGDQGEREREMYFSRLFNKKRCTKLNAYHILILVQWSNKLQQRLTY